MLYSRTTHMATTVGVKGLTYCLHTCCLFACHSMEPSRLLCGIWRGIVDRYRPTYTVRHIRRVYCPTDDACTLIGFLSVPRLHSWRPTKLTSFYR